MDGKDQRMAYKLYWNQKAAVRVGIDQSEWMDIKRAVIQGSVLFPDLLSMQIYEINRREGRTCYWWKNIKKNLRYAEDANEINRRTGMVRYWWKSIKKIYIRYADDTILIADSQEKVQDILTTVKDSSEEKSLTINVEKAEVMVISIRFQDVV